MPIPADTHGSSHVDAEETGHHSNDSQSLLCSNESERLKIKLNGEHKMCGGDLISPSNVNGDSTSENNHSDHVMDGNHHSNGVSNGHLDTDAEGTSERSGANGCCSDNSDPTMHYNDEITNQKIVNSNSNDVRNDSSVDVTHNDSTAPLLVHSGAEKTNGDSANCVKPKCTSSSKPPVSRATSCYDNAPDGGWGWVVTFAAFMVGVILDGISFSFGIFYRELLLHFKESKSVTSWIISVLNGTYLGIGPIASILVTVFGCRPVAIFGAILASIAFFLCTYSPNVQVMILVYGLLGGAGLGLLYLPSIVTVGHYFKKKRALATGIAVCGSGIGGFVFAPLSELLIELYTWKGAMWIISAIVLHGIPIAVLLRPLKGSETYSERTKQIKAEQAKLIENGGTVEVSESKACCDISSMFDFELLGSPTFLVYGLSCFLCMLGFFIPFTFIPDLANDFGMSSQQGAMLISIIGILNTGARVLVGWLADRSWADPLLINSVALLIGGTATMFVPLYSKYSMLATYCVVFGISIAVFVSYRSIIMAELLGIEKLTSSFGLVTMCQGLSAFIGAPIAGALSDEAGDYTGAFYLAGIAIALSGVICFPLRPISRWENRRKNRDVPVSGAVLSSNMSMCMEMSITAGPLKV